MGNILFFNEIGLITIRAVLLGRPTEFSDNDRLMGDNKTRPKTSAGSSHGKSVKRQFGSLFFILFMTL